MLKNAGVKVLFCSQNRAGVDRASSRPEQAETEPPGGPPEARSANCGTAARATASARKKRRPAPQHSGPSGASPRRRKPLRPGPAPPTTCQRGNGRAPVCHLVRTSMKLEDDMILGFRFQRTTTCIELPSSPIRLASPVHASCRAPKHRFRDMLSKRHRKNQQVQQVTPDVSCYASCSAHPCGDAKAHTRDK